uniref:UDP-glucosyltransferase n=1 Tax=Siraitia grosvenorii TaxID=190515 RepID=K7NBX6_SIRGR|nr:UDP-glucosyltransferase [Siraitia grosvenorii]
MVKEVADVTHGHGHVLLVSFPAQGHVNPLLRFGKLLASNGFLVTFCTAESAGKQMRRATDNISDSPKPIGDGFLRFEFFDDEWEEDDPRRKNFDLYFPQLKLVGTSFVSGLVAKQALQNTPVSFIINNPFFSWVLDLAEDLKIPSALFWIHSCPCFSAYYHYNSRSRIRFPSETDPFVDVQLPCMPVLKHDEIPSFLHPSFPAPAFRRVMLDQFENLSKASCILMDSFYELEAEVVDYMSKICPIKTVGPLFKNPSLLSAGAVRGDFFKPVDDCISWLDSRPDSSVVYISLGSVVQMNPAQVDEMVYGLLESGVSFLWAKKPSQENDGVEATDLLERAGEKGKIVEWSPQEQVLSHRAVSCTLTHCGWNSSMEAIASGVPVIGYSQWGDQVLNSKFLVEVFEMGVMMCRNDRQPSLISRHEIAKRLLQATVGPKAKEMKQNALRWKAAAAAALDSGGSSHRNILAFIDQLRAGKNHCSATS